MGDIMEGKEALRPWEELSKETLEDIQAALWKVKAINKAAYNALDYRASAGQTPDLKEQAEVMLLLEAAEDYIGRAEAILNRYI